MKKEYIAFFMLLLVASAASAEQVYTAVTTDTASTTVTAVDAKPKPAPVATSSGMVSKPIRRTLELDPLTDESRKAIDNQLRKHHDKKDDGNNQAYRNGLTLARQMNVMHLSNGKLDDRSPNDVHYAYQWFTEGRARDRFSLDVPAFKASNVPDFDLVDVPAIRNSVSMVASNRPDPGSTELNRDGAQKQVLVGSASYAETSIPKQKQVQCEPKPPPPDDPYCPGVNPPAPAPTDGPVGDPSWIEPNPVLPPGYVAPGAPPLPTGPQAPVAIPDRPWNPGPTAPPVADPVIPVPVTLAN